MLALENLDYDAVAVLRLASDELDRLSRGADEETRKQALITAGDLMVIAISLKRFLEEEEPAA
jgi:hypothetical protein